MPISYLYSLLISFLLGVFCATLIAISLPTTTWLFFMGFVAVIIWIRTKFIVEVKSWFLFGIILMAFSLGALRVEVANWSFNNSPLELEVGKAVSLSGVVIKEPEIKEGSIQLEVETERGVLLVSVDRYQVVSYGDEVLISGRLDKPKSFVTDLGRTFDYSNYLKAKGIEYRISFARLEVTGNNKGNFLVTALLKFKHLFMSKLEEVIAEPAVGLGEGLLLGVKQALGEELEAAFRKTGIIHIVVLSGYNIMLVVIFVMYILGHFLSQKPRVVIGIMAITAFAFLVGLSATVVRASIMASILLIVQSTNRIYLALRGLLLAGFIMILINPFLLLYDVGFQLSFLATLGLILISPHIESFFSKLPNWRGTRSFLVATIATQFAVLPLLLYKIGEFSVVAVLVNVLVLPMVSVAMLLTFMTGMTAFISIPLATVLAFFTYWSLTYINIIALGFSKLPFASFVVPPFPSYLVPVCYLIIGFLLWRFNRPHQLIGGGEDSLLLLQNKEVLNKNKALTGWVIEEESEEPLKRRTAERSSAVISNTDTPIFFR